ncbi:hypothetical protein [Nocardia transvalensis]|uniref:hypothetical protein n=1 Tax=Nocardia transvalensis TaxID=37333 RepID=UPI001894A6D1|nr:hypothetical protein [Nocardia transvalensis]MBF6333954.1 hypothetical protein [Nocardia transvalensis]
MARTITRTETFTRFSLLELQIRTMLREAAEIEPSSLDKISQGLREPHYIEVILVQGLYRRGTIGAELRLKIDWRTHRLELKSGGENIQAPASWAGGVAPSIAEGVRTFLVACTEAGLRREWSVIYGRQFDVDVVNRHLGFRRSADRRWERPPETSGLLGFGPLREASLVVSLAV